MEILELYLKNIKFDETVDSRTIARGCTGMTGADIKNLVNLAILNAIKEGRDTANAYDFD